MSKKDSFEVNIWPWNILSCQVHFTTASPCHVGHILDSFSACGVLLPACSSCTARNAGFVANFLILLPTTFLSIGAPGRAPGKAPVQMMQPRAGFVFKTRTLPPKGSAEQPRKAYKLSKFLLPTIIVHTCYNIYLHAYYIYILICIP